MTTIGNINLKSNVGLGFTNKIQGHAIQNKDTNQDSDVSLSKEAMQALREGTRAKNIRYLDTFGSTAHRNPPQPSSALEEMVYRRGGQKIDFITQNPPRWPDSNQILDYNLWLEYEKEIDQHTNTRIEIYEKAMLEGLSKEQIIKKIEQYNSTLGPRYFHEISVEDRPDDIERPKFQLPPKGDYTPDLMEHRKSSYDRMITAMVVNLKDLQSYE
jgi:hypothetical protein